MTHIFCDSIVFPSSKLSSQPIQVNATGIETFSVGAVGIEVNAAGIEPV